jgi:hypothetical protein
MKEKRNHSISGWVTLAANYAVLVIMIASLAGCAQTPNPTPQPVNQPTATTQTLPPTETALPSPMPTTASTATPEPTATATQPPTATPLPALAVLANGFNAWCAPQNSGATRPTGPAAPDYARKLVVNGSQLTVPIPATLCVISFRFNQPAPDGAMLTFFDGNNPFLKLPLSQADGAPEEAWQVVMHSYVVNPPFWSVNYRLSVTTADGKELWTAPVTFAKPLPKPCPYGGYPDPVTMYCTPTDPWEIEPKPGVVYPYPHTPPGY